MPSTIAVVLAAGAGSRFDGPDHKLLADLDGRSIIEASIDAAVAAEIGPVLVVTGAVDLRSVVARYQTHSDASDVTTAHNPDWAAGQATSLQVAVRVAARLGADAIVVGLGDQPFIDAAAWQAVAASVAPIAIASYGGARRNPVRLHRSVWHLLPAHGDEGARSLFRLKAELVDEVPCQGSATDIDTREDLQAWQSKSSTNSP
ncbi:MAG: nucleotidyltransferase family protein [Ilumatobacteraceae bacterium]